MRACSPVFEYVFGIYLYFAFRFLSLSLVMAVLWLCYNTASTLLKCLGDRKCCGRKCLQQLLPEGVYLCGRFVTHFGNKSARDRTPRNAGWALPAICVAAGSSSPERARYFRRVSATARTSMTCLPGTFSARRINWPRPFSNRNLPKPSGRKSFTNDSLPRSQRSNSAPTNGGS